MSPSRRRYLLREQVPMLVLLTVVWILLSGSASLLTILSGLLLALLITWAFPMPGVDWGGRLRPLGMITFAVTLLAQLAVASVRLALVAFSRHPRPRSGVVAIRLASDSDIYQVGTASLLSVVPGSVVVDARRKTRTLYLHIFDTAEEDIPAVKEHGLDAEQLVMGALASKKEITAARERRAAREVTDADSD